MHGVALTLVAPLGLLVDLVERGLLLAGDIALQLILDAVDRALCGYAAVADRGEEIVHVREGEALEDDRQHLVGVNVRRRDARLAQLALEHLLAVGDVLLAPLLFEPLLDLRARRAAFGELQPVAVRAGRVLARADLDDVAVFEHMVKVHDAPVHLRADHRVADAGVDRIRKVDRRRAGGEGDYVALRGEDEHLVGKHVDLQVVEKVLRVRFLLRLEQAADPGELLLVAGLHAGVAGFVFPVRRHAVFRREMHLPRAQLHLEGDALIADDRRVHGAVVVRLRRGDIVLEPPGHGLEHAVNYAQRGVAVGHVVRDHAEGAEVEDAVDVDLLRVHFAVDAVDMLDARGDRALDALGLQARMDLRLNVAHEALERVHARVQIFRDRLIAIRVEVAQGEVLQLPLDALHAQPVRDGGVDLHRLERFDALLLLGLVVHRAHIVQAVRHFDEDHADIVRHGEEHLAQIFHLLLFLRHEGHARQLRHALHEIRHRGAEAAGDVLVRDGRVLHAVVQQGGHDAVLVQSHLGRDDRGRNAVRHVGRAVLALLPGVGALGHLKGGAHAV